MPDDKRPTRRYSQNVVPQAYEPNPDQPVPLSGFRLFAVVKTWMDEDIIEATIRNALIQGVETVFVVDNGSTDQTVQNAEAAGAVIADVYRSEFFDPMLTQTLVNSVVARESLLSGSEHVWWLYLDSDEFPEGPDSMSVRDYLASLDKRFRIVGATGINHLPDSKPEYSSGFHPIDFQPLSYEFIPNWSPPCGLRHWKHPLLRFDRRSYFMQCAGGSHWAICEVPEVEPIGGIVIHHFQYRGEESTRRRLELVCGQSSDTGRLPGSRMYRHFDLRLRSLDAVYAQRWAEAETESDGLVSRDPKPWGSISRVRRWYPHVDTTMDRRPEPEGVYDLVVGHEPPEEEVTQNCQPERKVVLLTGASGQIGTAFCGRYANTYNIVAVRNKRPLTVSSQYQSYFDPFASEPDDSVAAAEGSVFEIKADLREPTEVSRVVEVALARFGRIDVIVNAIGSFDTTTNFLGGALTHAPEQFMINAVIPTKVAVAVALGYWRHHDRDNARCNRAVVNISATASIDPGDRCSGVIFGATKAAYNLMTLRLAEELKPYNVRVAAVAPAPVPDIVTLERVTSAIASLIEGDENGRLLLMWDDGDEFA